MTARHVKKTYEQMTVVLNSIDGLAAKYVMYVPPYIKLVIGKRHFHLSYDYKRNNFFIYEAFKIGELPPDEVANYFEEIDKVIQESE